ncbi:MAG: hypothetical protein IPJ71_04265 [Bdellovibrionales bacterium]|nr:hypothetical protein [Bdellovibrionales bacterium]
MAIRSYQELCSLKQMAISHIKFIFIVSLFFVDSIALAHREVSGPNRKVVACSRLILQNTAFRANRNFSPLEVDGTRSGIYGELSILNVGETLFTFKKAVENEEAKAVSVDRQALDLYEAFILKQFSLLKHGETTAIRYFSQLMANHLISDIKQRDYFYQFMMDARRSNKQILVTSPATRFISNSARFLAEQLVHDLNIYLVEKGYPVVTFRPLHKRQPSNPNYAGLEFNQRNQLDNSLSSVIKDSAFEGQFVLYVDDIVLTGLTIEKHVRLFREMGTSEIFVFTPIHLDRDFGQNHAYVELLLNSFEVEDLNSLTAILRAKYLQITQKMLRVLFSKENKPKLMAYLIKNVPLNNIAAIYEEVRMVPLEERSFLLDAEQFEILRIILDRNGLIAKNGYLTNNWKEISNLSIQISPSVKKEVVRFVKIDSFAQMTNDPNRIFYNLLKLGLTSAIRNIATKMANSLEESTHFQRAVLAASGKIAVTPSAYGSTPTAAFYLREVVFDLLSQRHPEWDIKKIRIVREGGFSSSDYGTADTAGRERMMNERRLSLNPQDTEVVKGRLVLVVDDSRISGKHEIKIDDFLSSRDIGSVVFSYFYQFSNQFRQELPSLESELNHGFFGNLKELNDYLESNPLDKMLITARNLKFVLDKKNMDGEQKHELERFFTLAGTEFLLSLYREATSTDGYYRLPQYREAFYFLEQYLIACDLIQKNGLRFFRKSVAQQVLKELPSGQFVGENNESLEFLARQYSLMKFGSKIDIRDVAKRITDRLSAEIKLMGSPLRKLFDDAKSRQLNVLLGTPGVRNVGSASSFVFELVTTDLNNLLSELDLPIITLVRFSRFNSNPANYADISANERRRANSRGQTRLPGREFFENSIFIFADDIYVSGTTADRYIDHALDSGAADVFSIFGMIVDPSLGIRDPSVENRLNTFR